MMQCLYFQDNKTVFILSGETGQFYDKKQVTIFRDYDQYAAIFKKKDTYHYKLFKDKNEAFAVKPLLTVKLYVGGIAEMSSDYYRPVFSFKMFDANGKEMQEFKHNDWVISSMTFFKYWYGYQVFARIRDPKGVSIEISGEDIIRLSSQNSESRGVDYFLSFLTFFESIAENINYRNGSWNRNVSQLIKSNQWLEEENERLKKELIALKSVESVGELKP